MIALLHLVIVPLLIVEGRTIPCQKLWEISRSQEVISGSNQISMKLPCAVLRKSAIKFTNEAKA